jgi:broad specificity phosphatase PhoE
LLTLILQHGESMLNLDGRIGGDSLLSHRGEEYARALPGLVRASVGVSKTPLVLSSWQCLSLISLSHRMIDLLRCGRRH